MNRKQKYLKLTLIAISIAACIALAYSFIFPTHSVSYYKQQIKKIESRLHKKQSKLETKSINLLNTVCAAAETDLHNILFKTEIKCNSDEGIFCFLNDSLIYWSSNLPIDDKSLLKLNSTEKFTNFNENIFAEESTTESWYVAQAYSCGKFKVVYAITILTNYFYENDLLQSGFNQNLEISPSLFFENLGNGGFAVCGQNETPLFELGTDVSNNTNHTSMFLRWFGIAIILLVLVVVAIRFCRCKTFVKTLVYLIMLFACTIFLAYNYFGTFNAKFSFFDSSFYASSKLLPSFGILFLYVIFIFIIIYTVFTQRRCMFSSIQKGNAYKRGSIICGFALASAIQSVLCVLLTITLTRDSNFSLDVYKINTINSFSILSYVLIALMFTGFVMLHILCLYKVKSIRHKITVITIQLTVAILLLLIFGVHHIFVLCLFAVYFILLSRVVCRIKSRLTAFIKFVALSTVFCVSVVLYEGFYKTRQITQNVAESLSQKNDPVFEALFAEIIDKLMVDSQLHTYVQDSDINTDAILHYLVDNYFHEYFARYHLELNLCTPKDSLYVSEPAEKANHNCYSFFDSEKNTYGNQIEELPLWFMEIDNGKINYLAQLSYFNDTETKLFLNFTSLSEQQYIGYPELLFDKKNQPNQLLQQNNYSYAKYFKNKLVSRYGDFEYSYEINSPNEIKNRSFLTYRGYLHYCVEIDNNNLIVVSAPTISLLEFLSSNSLVFLFFVVVLSILLYFTGFDVLELQHSINFKQKTRILLLALVFALLVLVGGTIFWHTFSQFEQNKIESIEDKVHLIDNEFALQYGTTDSITDPHDLSMWLIELSNLHHIDINVYGTDGKLIATSRPEIFNYKLLGLHINRLAFSNMYVRHQPYYINSENIGKLQFKSVYMAFYNNSSKKLVYVMLPYFEQQRKFQEKWLILANTIINIFIIALILGLLFATVISKLLSKPLDTVRLQIGKFSLTGKSEHIQYKGNDEIGSLVKTYNSMLDQLSESVTKLAQTEREHAWREMAQQIAHEIKNPLTPMQLSLQHVLRLKKDNSPEWEKHFETTAKSLLEQIDVLSITAAEFSDFAKMTNQAHKDIDVIDLLEKQMKLFGGYEKIKITLTVEGRKSKIVSALYEQLQRVFTNIIKNAIQAIGDDCEGEINITACDLPDMYYQFAIENSGAKIREEQRLHLFSPKFTTKSSGTGLGLAISKNLIENFGGRIYYSPTLSGKTCFIVELPCKPE